MSSKATEQSPLVTARVAGILYLLMFPLGILGMMVVPSTLIDPGNVSATISNIKGSETLFRLSILSALVTQLINIVLVLVLYKLLKPVSKKYATLMVVFFLVAVPIAMLDELNRFAVLMLLDGTSFVPSFTPDQVYLLVPFFLELHKYGVSIAGIFWGLWLFPMGYLVFRSGFLPRILGILLMIGCLGYLIDSFALFLVPHLEINVAAFTFWGEVLLPLWLVFKGINVEKWKTQSRC